MRKSIVAMVLLVTAVTAGQRRVFGAEGVLVPARLTEPVNQRSIFIYSGFVNVAKAGTYTLKMPVDDGDELTIGGMTNPQDPAYQAAVTFSEPGIYPFQVLHWDRV